MTDFNKIFKKTKERIVHGESTQESEYQTEVNDSSECFIDDSTETFRTICTKGIRASVKTFLTFTFVISILLNVALIYIAKEGSSIVASPEYVLWKQRINPLDDRFNKALYNKAYNMVCEERL